jgi:hypothetical protein
MANIAISDLNSVELEFAELSNLELEAVMGGKGRPKIGFEVGLGPVKVGVQFLTDNMEQ